MTCPFCTAKETDKSKYNILYECGSTNEYDAGMQRSNKCYQNHLELVLKANEILSKENDSLCDKLADQIAMEFPKENPTISDLIKIAHKLDIYSDPLDDIAIIIYNIMTCVDDSKGKIENPKAVGLDLAGAVIRIFDFCGYHKIDLEGCIIEQMQFNESQPKK